MVEIDIDEVPFGDDPPATPKRRNYFGETFSGRPISLLKSSAFSVLNLAEHKMLLRIEVEAASHAGCGNGRWPITFEQFVAAPSRCALVALGLITFRPGVGSADEDKQRASQFGLTYATAAVTPRERP
jgi:hypothetical protein